MIGEYKTGTKYSQSAICKYTKSSVVNTTADIYEMEDALWYTTRKNTSSKSSYLKFSTSQGQIDDKRPFIVRVAWSSGGGHAIVIDGYQETTYKYLHYRNPTSGSGSGFARYHNMVNGGTTYKSASKGVWSHTVYIVKGGWLLWNISLLKYSLR